MNVASTAAAERRGGLGGAGGGGGGGGSGAGSRGACGTGSGTSSTATTSTAGSSSRACQRKISSRATPSGGAREHIPGNIVHWRHRRARPPAAPRTRPRPPPGDRHAASPTTRDKSRGPADAGRHPGTPGPGLTGLAGRVGPSAPPAGVCSIPESADVGRPPDLRASRPLPEVAADGSRAASPGSEPAPAARRLVCLRREPLPVCGVFPAPLGARRSIAARGQRSRHPGCHFSPDLRVAGVSVPAGAARWHWGRLAQSRTFDKPSLRCGAANCISGIRKLGQNGGPKSNP